MKKRHQRLMLNLLAFCILAGAIYFVFIQKEKPFVPASTLNANASANK